MSLFVSSSVWMFGRGSCRLIGFVAQVRLDTTRAWACFMGAMSSEMLQVLASWCVYGCHVSKLREPYDIGIHPKEHDITSTMGYAVAIRHVLALRPAGLLYAGLPCCSYTWVSSSRHRRSASQPMGDLSVAWVRYRNKSLAVKLAFS